MTPSFDESDRPGPSGFITGAAGFGVPVALPPPPFTPPGLLPAEDAQCFACGSGRSRPLKLANPAGWARWCRMCGSLFGYVPDAKSPGGWGAFTHSPESDVAEWMIENAADAATTARKVFADVLSLFPGDHDPPAAENVFGKIPDSPRNPG